MYRGKHQKVKALFSISLIISFFCSQTVWALPQDGTVAAGGSTITQPDANTMHINQSTDKSIINWQGYSIGANEKVQYTQPGSGSISLNRVIGQDPSLIYGQLSANGQVWVINPNGLLIGQDAKINVGGFLASTLNINDNDFLDGNYRFQTMSQQLSAISNYGNINAADGGYVVLISPSITNEGNITTNSGKTYLASADEVTLTFAGNDLIGFTIDKATAQDALGIKNTGTITADGGQVILSAKAATDLLKTVINNEGIIQARTIENKNGTIKLLGGMENNAINVGGTLDASAPDGGDGGFIETSAASVKIADDAVITTYAPYGTTGEWLIDPNDYTIAASGGDITGATLSTNLGTTDVTILSSDGGTAGNGDIFVNDAVSWSANTLTLTAARDININAVMTASGTSALVMNTATPNGSDTGVAGGTVKVGFNPDGTFKGRVDFPDRSGAEFLTINLNGYTVINDLGAADSMITTDLQGMSGGLAGYYALGSDIDAAATATAAWNGDAGFTPVGNGAARFTGAFDGLGHTITGLTSNRPGANFIGLFGYTNGAAISNVGLVDGSVKGLYYTGGLVGRNENGTITNSYSTGAVTSSGNVGGLVGSNYSGAISNSYATGAVSGSGNYRVGGLVGLNYSGAISNSYATGAVSGNYRVGGLVGWNYSGANITDSYSTGDVTSTGSEVGGLVGFNSSSANITDSYSTGDVTSTGSEVGGLVGYNYSGANITDSHSTGAVTGSSHVGGLVGYNNSAVNNSYWDMETSGQSTSAGGTELTTSQMMTQASFIGWDFTNIWIIYEGYTYPLLKSFLTPLTVTANDDSKTYDGLAYTGGNGVTYSITPNSNLLGTLAYSGTSQGAINAGGYVITPGGYYSNQQGYDISYANGALTITPAPLTITADDKSKVYGDANPALTATYTGLVNDETSAVVSGLNISTAATTGSNVGTYTITAADGTAANYIISFVNGILTITPAPLTITADDKSKVYGDANPALTATYTGLVNDETSAVVSGLNISTAATTGSNVGTYTITAADGTAANYIISFVNGILTITPAPVAPSYTDVIQEWLGSASAIEAAEQPAKFEGVYASADSFTETGLRPLITDYRPASAKAKHLCLIMKKKGGNPAIVESENCR